MEKTQNGLRKRIALIGRVNAGKSSLMNAIIKDKVALVSAEPGTTTDTVQKAFEILDFGPVVLCDTAGFGDTTTLGRDREAVMRATLKGCDLAVWVRTSDEPDMPEWVDFLTQNKIPFLVVYNKVDVFPAPTGALATNALTGTGVDDLIRAIATALSGKKAETVLDGLVTAGQSVLLVTPIDESAPVGRLILPQVQLMRELLDKHALTTVVQVEEIPVALARGTYDLLITDSRVVKEVLTLVPDTQKVSTFSVLFARAKGDFDAFLAGTDVIDSLVDGDKILLTEACVHTTKEDDIAKAVIPKLLQKHTGKQLDFHFASGKKLPDNLADFKLVIHCGACMLTRREMLTRIEDIAAAGVAVTNYGLTITKCQMGNLRRLTF